jgi:cell division protein FtsB
MTKRSLKLLIILLTILLGALQWQWWGGQGSLLNNRALKQTLAVEREKTEALKKEQLRLTEEILDMKEGVGLLEELARDDLGLIKPGEIFVQIQK